MFDQVFYTLILWGGLKFGEWTVGPSFINNLAEWDCRIKQQHLPLDGEQSHCMKQARWLAPHQDNYVPATRPGEGEG